MILIAAIAILAIGIATWVLMDPPQVDGWLRSLFGTVFATMAIVMAAVLGIPAAIGVWSMAGATHPDLAPALPHRARRAVTLTAVVVLAVVAGVVLIGGRGVTLLDLGLLGLAALLTMGLAGAATFSPRRGRATMAVAALGVVLLGLVWFVIEVLIIAPA
jgi:hypothetical protein